MTEPSGIVSVRSKLSVDVLADRLEAAITAHGLTLFARIDHGEGARQVGMALRPTILFILGGAKGGTPLMQIDQIAGLDLPLKILLWQDEAGIAWVSFVDPNWIAQFRNLGAEGAATGAKLHAFLAGLAGGIAE
ncbi:MAG: DUF302 domain-containing protein [Caulobacteraceae bacterium]